MMKFKAGQMIYYRGDVANNPGWFEIVSGDEGKFGVNYQMVEVMEAGAEESPRSFDIGERLIDEVDKGHCGTKFVTKEAYDTYRAAVMAKYQK